MVFLVSYIGLSQCEVGDNPPPPPPEGSHDPPVTPAQNTTNVALWPRLLFYNSIVM